MVWREEQVLRFDIQVDDPVIVGAAKGIKGFRSDPNRIRNRKRSLPIQAIPVSTAGQRGVAQREAAIVAAPVSISPTATTATSTASESNGCNTRNNKRWTAWPAPSRPSPPF